MSIKYTNELGSIEIDDFVIQTIAGSVVTSSYGIVGMVSSDFKNGISALLKRDNLTKGVKVITSEDKLILNLHVIVKYGTKIPEIAKAVQDKVAYTIKSMLDIDVYEVNVMVEGLDVSDIN